MFGVFEIPGTMFVKLFQFVPAGNYLTDPQAVDRLYRGNEPLQQVGKLPLREPASLPSAPWSSLNCSECSGQRLGVNFDDIFGLEGGDDIGEQLDFVRLVILCMCRFRRIR